jgi:Serine/threonine protein kinase
MFKSVNVPSQAMPTELPAWAREVDEEEKDDTENGIIGFVPLPEDFDESAPRTIYSDDPVEVGSQLDGRYEILKKVGVGGMGTVYEAEHLILRRRVALKILKRALVSDPLAIARFEKEARACAALFHPNLVPIYDCGVTREGQPFLVMEYLKGEGLDLVLEREKRLDINRFFNIFIQVAGGLAEAHENGVIHRDLKPENVVLVDGAEGREVAKVVDFGIAKVEEFGSQLQMLTQTGEVFGSPSYMSPEQCQAGTIDNRTDVYSLGCVMYETLTGRKAFPGFSIAAVIENQIDKLPPAPEEFLGQSKLPGNVAEVVMKCLAKNPDERFQSMRELEEELTRAKNRAASGIDAQPASKRMIYARLIYLVLIVMVGMGTVAFAFTMLHIDKKGGTTAGAIVGTPSKGVVTETRIAPKMAYALYTSRLGLEAMSEKTLTNMLNGPDSRGTNAADKCSIAFVLASIYSNTNRPDDAQRIFQQMSGILDAVDTHIKDARKNPANGLSVSVPLLYYYAAKAQWTRQAYNDAESKFLRAIRLSQRLNSPIWIRARLKFAFGEFLNEKRPAEALAPLKEALSLMKRDTDLDPASRADEMESMYLWIYSTCRKLELNDEAEKYLLQGIAMRLADKKSTKAAPLIEELIEHLGTMKRTADVKAWQQRLAFLDRSTTAGATEMQRGTLKTASPLVLLDRAAFMSRDGLTTFEPTMMAAWARGEELKLPDIERLAIASMIMRNYIMHQKPVLADGMFEKARPLVTKMTSTFSKSGTGGGYAFTGSAPLVCMYGAEARILQGNFEVAEMRCKEGLQLAQGQPDGAWLQGRLQLMLARSYAEGGKVAEAERLLTQVLPKVRSYTGGVNPQVAETLRLFAVVYEKQKRYQRADLTLRQAVAILQALPGQERKIEKDYTPALKRLEKLKSKG